MNILSDVNTDGLICISIDKDGKWFEIEKVTKHKLIPSRTTKEKTIFESEYDSQNESEYESQSNDDDEENDDVSEVIASSNKIRTLYLFLK